MHSTLIEQVNAAVVSEKINFNQDIISIATLEEHLQNCVINKNRSLKQKEEVKVASKVDPVIKDELVNAKNEPVSSEEAKQLEAQVPKVSRRSLKKNYFTISTQSKETSYEEESNVILKCRRDHVLEICRIHPHHTCDVCRRSLRSGDDEVINGILRCKNCDYDLCHGCRDKLRPPPKLNKESIEKVAMLRAVMNDYTSQELIIFVTVIYALSNISRRQSWLSVIRFLFVQVSGQDVKSDKD